MTVNINKGAQGWCDSDAEQVAQRSLFSFSHLSHVYKTGGLSSSLLSKKYCRTAISFDINSRGGGNLLARGAFICMLGEETRRRCGSYIKSRKQHQGPVVNVDELNTKDVCLVHLYQAFYIAHGSQTFPACLSIFLFDLKFKPLREYIAPMQ